MIYQNYQVIFPYFYFSAYPLLHKSYFSDGLNQRKNDNLYVCAGEGSTGYETFVLTSSNSYNLTNWKLYYLEYYLQ